jgi:hypothetical protein
LLANQMSAVEEKLKDVLEPGETVLWCMPIEERAIRRIRKNRMGCAVILTVLLPVMLSMMWAAGWTGCALLGGLVIGGYVCNFLGSRIWINKARAAAYVVTNRRALILAPVPQVVGPWQGKPQVVSIRAAELAKRTVVLGNNGWGDVVFWHRKFVTALSESTFKESLDIRFANVPEVAKVDALLNTVANGETDNAALDEVAPDKIRCANVGLISGGWLHENRNFRTNASKRGQVANNGGVRTR